MIRNNSLNSGLKMVDKEKKPGSFVTMNVKEEEKVADINVTNIIGDAWEGTTAKEFINQLKDLSDKIETINVDISSPGGGIWQAIDIYNALKKHPATVNTHTASVCASAAVIVYMAGDNRVAGPYADFMIHKPTNLSWGNADDLREVADRLDRDQEKIVNIYIDNGCKEGKEDLHNMMNETTWFNADRAVDMGFATEKSDELEAAACLFDLDSLNGCPEHHKRIANAMRKRQQEQTERDAGASAKEAKAKVSEAAERDASKDVTAELCDMIHKLEIK